MFEDDDDWGDNNSGDGYLAGCPCAECQQYNKESAMGYGKSSYGVGFQFVTGNAVVKSLEPGTILEVVGSGQLEVVESPFSLPQPGDRIETKYGMATVVRNSSRIPVSLNENEVLYVADGTNVVRRQQF